MEFPWKILGLWILMKFDRQAPLYTLFPGKINAKQLSVKNLNFPRRLNLDRFIDSLKSKLDF
jgi:hypothetical protein